MKNMSKRAKNAFFATLFILSAFFVYSAAFTPQVEAAKINGVSVTNQVYLITAAAGNDFSAGDIGYIKSDETIALANAGNAATANGLLMVAVNDVTGGNTGVFRKLEGDLSTTGLTAGATYYLDTADGQISTTAPEGEGTSKRVLGVALNSTTLVFSPVTSPTTTTTTTDTGGGTTTTVGPAILESYSTAFESDGTITTTAPADIVSENFIGLFAATDESDATETTYTPPSGFSTLVTQQRANSGAAGTDFGAWYKIAGTSESTSYDLGESGLKNTATIMLRISGVDPNDAVDTYSCTTGTTEFPTSLSVNTTVDDAMVITAYAWDATKSVNLAPAGITQIAHNDQSGIDLWLGYEIQAISGASTARVMDLSASTPWVACTIALKEPNATSTPTGSGGGGGGTTAGEGPGPFSLADDGTGNPIKLTLPVACDDTLFGSPCEIFPSNYVGYDPNKPDLLTYEHPTYFIRDPSYYRFCSPNAGATTTNASNGRSELRYLANVTSGTISRQFIFEAPSASLMDNNVKANVGQIHRGRFDGVSASPTFKGTYTNKSDGTGIWRALVKKVDQGTDFAFDIGLGDKVLMDSINAGDFIRVKYEWDIAAETLKFWTKNDGATKVETELTDGTADHTHTLTSVVLGGSGYYAYSKLGLYMNDPGDGVDTDVNCIDIYQDIYTGP